jgi:hypothetical protein
LATLTSELPLLSLRRSAEQHQRRHGALLAALLTPLALLIHGYHPYAEDGGVYLAGVKKFVHPELYPHSTAFVLAPTRFSAFAWLVSGFARMTRLTNGVGFDALILVLHLATIWATLYAADLLVCRCWENPSARYGAVLLLTCWLALPVAGTSLLLMDPYLTARSFSTPCMIVALIGALDATAPLELGPVSSARRSGLLLAFGALAVAAILHPLMAIYAALATLLVFAFRLAERGARLTALVCVCGAFLTGYAAVASLALPESPHYIAIAFTRGYWFLSQWRWYELAGIVAPAAILFAYSVHRDKPEAYRQPASIPARKALSAAAVLCAILVTAVALLFARRGAHTHLAAALQPLRELQFVYLAMILHLGATLGDKLLRRNQIAWLLAVPILGGPLLFASHAAAPNSRHIELPGLASRNPWVQAFLWARDHTRTDALFALPSDYTSQSGEDAQCFRAIAQRSALADDSKDGGEAAVDPALTQLWAESQAAQAYLLSEPDATRRGKLKPLGVDWLVLAASSPTALNCPYSNDAAKVCRLL